MEACPSQQGNALACAMPAGHGGVHWQHPENRGCWWNDEMATAPGSIPLEPNAQPEVPLEGLVADLRQNPTAPLEAAVTRHNLPQPSICQSSVTDPLDGAGWQCNLPYGHTGEHRWGICLTDDRRRGGVQGEIDVRPALGTCPVSTQGEWGWGCTLRAGHPGDHAFPRPAPREAWKSAERAYEGIQGPVLASLAPTLGPDAGPSLEVLQLGEAAYLTVCYTSASRLDDLRRVAFVLLAEIVRREGV